MLELKVAGVNPELACASQGIFRSEATWVVAFVRQPNEESVKNGSLMPSVANIITVINKVPRTYFVDLKFRGGEDNHPPSLMNVMAAIKKGQFIAS